MSFKGTYTTRWISHNLYEYIPDSHDPLVYTRPDGYEIVIDDRFLTTDFGTIPRVFWCIPGFAPNDLERPSLVHDALFERNHRGWYGGVSSREMFKEVNLVLYEALRDEGYPKWMAWLLKKGCDWFGWSVWNRIDTKDTNEKQLCG